MIPLQLFVAALVGWLQGDQHKVIEYLREENRVLKAQLQNQRLRLTDGDRRRLAARGAALGRRLLAQVATIVTADTILRWHCQLIARNGRIRGAASDGPTRFRRFVASWCEWRPTTQAGATRASRAR